MGVQHVIFQPWVNYTLVNSNIDGQASRDSGETVSSRKTVEKRSAAETDRQKDSGIERRQTLRQTNKTFYFQLILWTFKGN